MEHHGTSRTTVSTVVRYLKTRSTECWGFFAAGFLIAAILA